MTFLPTLTVLALLALATPARAGPVEDAGAALARSGDRLSDVAGRRQGIQAELDQVAARIEALKRKDQRDRPVLQDGSLDGLLRRSQELAAALSSAAREEDAARSEQASAADLLVTACDRELASLHTAVAAGDGAALARASELTTRRDQARSLRPRSAVLAPIQKGAPSDDPRELRERADLLRDQHDRLMARADELSGRIAERRQQDQLDRAMGSFMRQSALFDESRRVLTAPQAAAAAQVQSSAGSRSSPAPAIPVDAADTKDTVTFGAGGPAVPAIPAATAPAPAPAAPVPAFGGDARGPTADVVPVYEGSSLQQLQSARDAVLSQARALEAEAARLDARARDLGAGK